MCVCAHIDISVMAKQTFMVITACVVVMSELFVHVPILLHQSL